MKEKNIQTLKGFRDFLPEEALKRKWLMERIEKIFQKWGYDPIVTPTLEKLEVFKNQVGADEKLFYRFKDRGNRDVALRYDQTVPACRVIGQYYQKLPMPFKRYQIQNVFRAEKPQKGRYREFLQCDADIFGAASPTSDAEVIGLSLDIYKELGFKKVVAYINDRELLKNIPYKALSTIDKIKKIKEENVLKEMEEKGIESKKAKEYLSYIKKLKPNSKISIIFDYLKKLGFDKSWYEFDPFIIRSFAYSTGIIWEIEVPGFEGGSVLGGERYDNLVKDIAGVYIPGTGFGLGFDRTLEAAEQFNLIPNLKTSTKVLVTVFNEKLLQFSLYTAQKLRKEGINTEVYPNPGAKLEKQLKYASKKGIPYVLIIGDEEAKQNKVTLRNMNKNTQKTTPLKQTVLYLQRNDIE